MGETTLTAYFIGTTNYFTQPTIRVVIHESNQCKCLSKGEGAKPRVRRSCEGTSRTRERRGEAVAQAKIRVWRANNNT